MTTAILLHGITSSGLTWWRVGRDLTDLGWTVHAPDLAGHGQNDAELATWTVDTLAADVYRRFPDGTDLLVGHSLGALVAATLAASHPGWARAVVLEDPPALNGSAVPPQEAQHYLDNARRARTEPQAVRAELRATEPLWAPPDIDNVVTGRSRMQADTVRAAIIGARWDLPALIAAVPAPTLLLAATEPGTALRGPDRATALAAATESRVVASGHSIHRDRPALWLAEVVRFAREHDA